MADRRRRLVQGLEDIFLREGFRRVSIGALASRLHCSRRALYELAPGKERLFLLVLEGLLTRIREQGDERARATPDVASRIEAYLAPGIAEMRRASHFFSSDVASLPEAHRALEEHQQRRMRGIRDIIADGVGQGVFRGFDPHLVAEVFAFGYRRVSEPDFLAETRLSMAEAYRELSQLLRHGLLHPPDEALTGASDRR